MKGRSSPLAALLPLPDQEPGIVQCSTWVSESHVLELSLAIFQRVPQQEAGIDPGTSVGGAGIPGSTLPSTQNIDPHLENFYDL